MVKDFVKYDKDSAYGVLVKVKSVSDFANLKTDHIPPRET